MWTPEKEQVLRNEVELLFRRHTPAKDILDVDWRVRVPRTEICNLGEYLCGQMPPVFDRAWLVSFCKWYNRMAKKALKELDPSWLDSLTNFPPSPDWTRQE
jgi:hypothetical protein